MKLSSYLFPFLTAVVGTSSASEVARNRLRSGAETETASNISNEISHDADDAWKQACLVGLRMAKFDFLETERYNEWYTEDSVMQLSQSGTFTGPEEMTEYVDFTRAKFFDYYKRVGKPNYYPISLAEKECVVMIVTNNKMQVNANYGQPACLETTVGFKMQYTVSDLQGNGFNIHRMNLFYSPAVLHTLFADALKGDGVRDFICETILQEKCPLIWEENDLDVESCKLRYDALPSTDEGGYLDEKTTGCRILHSAFAEINPKHCAHMSFIPMKDYKGRTWCQESGGVVPEDLFTEEELLLIEKNAIDMGYDKDAMYKSCNYTAPDSSDMYVTNY